MLTEQQRKDRKLGIGGSDVPIIMGQSSFMTPVQLWLQKRGELELDDTQSPQAYWGSILEDLVRQEFAKRNNVTVEQPDTIIHPKYDYFRGNLDGYIPELDAVLEVKTCNQFMSHEWGQDGTGIPHRYLLQIAFYCMVKNASKAYCAVLIGGQDYREYVYERDEWLEDEILEACHKFWNCVQSGEQPDAQYADMKYLYKGDADKSIVMQAEHFEKLKTLRDIKVQRKLLDKAEEITKFNIMDYMKDAEYLTDLDGKVLVSWKAGKRGRTFLVKGE